MDSDLDGTEKCSLCGNHTKTLKPQPPDRERGPYLHCHRCDLIFLPNDQILPPYEEKQRYMEHDNTHENEGYVQMFEDFISETVLPFCQEGKALDFGCGPGPVLADLLKKRGFSVDIYDPFFFPNDRYRNETYDLVTTTEVFEHLRNPEQVLEELCCITKPGSILAVMTHLHQGPDEFSEWWYHWDPTHITFYSSKTMMWITDNWPLDIIFSDNFKHTAFVRK